MAMELALSREGYEAAHLEVHDDVPLPVLAAHALQQLQHAPQRRARLQPARRVLQQPEPHATVNSNLTWLCWAKLKSRQDSSSSLMMVTTQRAHRQAESSARLGIIVQA